MLLPIPTLPFCFCANYEEWCNATLCGVGCHPMNSGISKKDGYTPIRGQMRWPATHCLWPAAVTSMAQHWAECNTETDRHSTSYCLCFRKIHRFHSFLEMV